jgi:DinB family protein
MHIPEPNEYDAYYYKYISLVDEPDLLKVLEAQPAQLNGMLAGLDEERGRYAYAEGKWSIKEAISHLIDAERIFAYRALRISRGDETPIEGFEQDGYIENSYANDRTFNDLLGELTESRQANLRMLKNLREGDWTRMGTASGNPISVRALGYIMAGHILHHVKIFREKYLII